MFIDPSVQWVCIDYVYRPLCVWVCIHSVYRPLCVWVCIDSVHRPLCVWVCIDSVHRPLSVHGYAGLFANIYQCMQVDAVLKQNIYK